MRTEAKSYNSKKHRTMSSGRSTERYDPGEHCLIVFKKFRTKEVSEKKEVSAKMRINSILQKIGS